MITADKARHITATSKDVVKNEMLNHIYLIEEAFDEVIKRIATATSINNRNFVTVYEISSLLSAKHPKSDLWPSDDFYKEITRLSLAGGFKYNRFDGMAFSKEDKISW